MRSIKEISIKYRTYYFFNDMINTKNFDSNLLKIGKTSYKNNDIYYIGYVTTRNIGDYENIHSVNPLNLIIGKVDEYIEESNGNKYLVFASTHGLKEVLAKFAKLWDEIKCLIEMMNGGEAGDCGKDFMKIRFKSDDHGPLGRILSMLAVVVRSVFEEDGKYYPQMF